MSEYILETKNLSYSISGIDILNNIDLKVKKNKFVGLIGPNGSGKTTLIKHFYRSILSKKDTIWINNKNLENYTQTELSKVITVMKQENFSDFDYTVYQMVLMGRAPYIKPYEGYSDKDINIAIDSLNKTGMIDKKDMYFSVLSGGEKQRVLIARALAQETDILLLDEPTNHLDIFYQLYLMQIISELDKTIISVFHDLNLAAKFCDYVYVLNKGEIVKQGGIDDVLTKEVLSEFFKVNAYINLEGGDNNKSIVFKNAIF